ncbi:MAG: glycosyltransferase family 39 protein [archaeon]
MNEQENKLEDKIKEFLKDKYHLILIGVILLALIIRLYFLIKTYNQPLWWDESEYINIAKYWSSTGPEYEINPQRPPFFMLLLALLYLIGSSEFIARFVMVLIPSVLMVLFTYLIGKDMFDKKIGLISSFIMSIFWLIIFNTARMHTDALAIAFNIATIYFFWKGYIKKKGNHNLYLMGFFLGLGFLTRLEGALMGVVILLFLIITERLKFLKNKHLWFSFLITMLTILPYLIWTSTYFGKVFAFSHGYSSVFTSTVTSQPFAWYMLNFMYSYFEWGLAIMFFIGLFCLYPLILKFDLLLKDKAPEVKVDLFLLIWIIVHLIFFIFITRGGEDRWLLPISAALFIITARGIMYIHDLIKNYSKQIALIVIFVILIFGAYQQLNHSYKIIELKKDSYLQEKIAGEWLKERVNDNDIIFSNNEQSPFTYYIGKRVRGRLSSETDFLNDVRESKATYYIITAFYPSPSWTFEISQKYQELFTPIQAFFFDKEMTKPAVIIFRINQEKMPLLETGISNNPSNESE